MPNFDINAWLAEAGNKAKGGCQYAQAEHAYALHKRHKNHQAYFWFRIANMQGCASSANNRKLLVRNGHITQDDKKAIDALAKQQVAERRELFGYLPKDWEEFFDTWG